MKNIFLLLLISIPVCCFSQNIKKLQDTCTHKWVTVYDAHGPTVANRQCIKCGKFENAKGTPERKVTLPQFPDAHKHKPNLSDSARRAGSGQYSQLLRDTTSIKNNVITYVNQHFICVNGEWYDQRKNVDTFSTRRKAKYSNLKYPKAKGQ